MFLYLTKKQGKTSIFQILTFQKHNLALRKQRSNLQQLRKIIIILSRTEYIVCCSLKVLLNFHNFRLLNITCTELYLGLLYRSYIIVQILNCKITEKVLLTGAICKRFFKGFTPVKMCGPSPLASFYFYTDINSEVNCFVKFSFRVSIIQNFFTRWGICQVLFTIQNQSPPISKGGGGGRREGGRGGWC